MMHEDKIKKIFAEAFEITEDEVHDDITYNSYQPWDSLKHLQLVSMLEEELGIELEMDDIIDMSSYKKVREIVLKYLT